MIFPQGVQSGGFAYDVQEISRDIAGYNHEVQAPMSAVPQLVLKADCW